MFLGLWLLSPSSEHILAVSAANITVSLPFSRGPILCPSYKDSCDYFGLLQMIPENLSLSRSLLISANSFCRMR